MPDPFANHVRGLTSPLTGAFAVTPSDGAELPFVTRQIRVTGNAGSIVAVWLSGVETTEPVSAGDVLDWSLKGVKATGTTATGLRGYY